METIGIIEFFHSIGVTPLHLILAYVGMFLHMLIKLGELNEQGNFNVISYAKKNIYTLISSIVMIPVLLILAADTSLKDVLPINNITSILAGWQTQSIFKSLMNFYSGRFKKIPVDNKNENQENNEEIKPDEIR